MHKIFTHKSIFSLGIFFAFALLPYFAHADVLLPGDISTCGELAAPGTYTLTADIDVGSTTSCMIISSNEVVIETNGFTLTGNITLEDTGGGSPQWTGASGEMWLGQRTWTFNDGSSNAYSVYGNATFNDSAYNYGGVNGDATFNTTYYHSGFDSAVGGTFTFDGSSGWYASVSGTVYGSDNQPITTYQFNSAPNYGTLPSDVAVNFDGDGGGNSGVVNGDAVFNTNTANAGTVQGNATFNGTCRNEGTVVGNATFNTTYYNNGSNSAELGILTISGVPWAGTVQGSIFDSNGQPVTQFIFNDQAYNSGTIPASAHAYFNGNSYNNGGSVLGDATFSTSYYGGGSGGGMFNFYGSVAWTGAVWGTVYAYDGLPVTRYYFYEDSYNAGTINGDVDFMGSSYNTGTVTGDSSFNGTCNYGYVNGDAFFSMAINYSSIDGTASFDSSSSNNGTVGNAVFNTGSANYNMVSYNAVFNDNSINGAGGTVSGNVVFNDSSTNDGTVSGNTEVHSPVVRPLGGIVLGLTTYYGYSGFYFNDKDTNDGDWGNVLNWWNNAAFTQPAQFIPFYGDDVYVYSDITKNSSDEAVVKSIVFENGSQNNINIITTNGAVFNGSGTNNGGIVGTTTFNGDLSNNNGTISISTTPWVNISGTVGQGWTSMTSSADGQYLVAVTGGGSIWRSTDFGESFSEVGGTGGASWTSITSSADGQYVVVTDTSGSLIWRSTDFGESFSEASGTESQNWTSITSSADGQYVVAVASGGSIWRSADFGESFSEVGGTGGLTWTSVTSSANGQYLVAVTNGTSIWRSTDFGVNWSEVSGTGSLGWTSITSDSTGQKLAAISSAGYPNSDILWLSNNFGVNWTSNANLTGWKFSSVHYSSNGEVLAVSSVFSSDENNPGKIFISTDDGQSWQSQTIANTTNWYSVTSNATGDRLFAINYGDNSIYKTYTVPDNSAPVIRIFTEAVSTVRNFLTEGGRNDWIIIAQGVIVDITNAIYDITTNIFKALNGGWFNTGSNPSVTPEIASNLPIANQVVTKWVPSIDWGNSTTCEYSYDNWTITNTADCSQGGVDIARPTAGSNTLSLRGTRYIPGVVAGGITEKNILFTYNNTVPTYTSCGSDLLDEATRPYYYLAGNVTGTCTATVDVELWGTSATSTATTTGYSITGGLIARGLDVSLKLIRITESVNTSGSSSGQNGGNLTIATSTTGDINSSGAHATGNGGNAGNILISNSIGITGSSTVITANGGNSTSCGNGGNSGDVTLTNSTYGTISTEPGNSANSGCLGQTKTSGQRRTPTVSGTYTPPGSGGNTNGNTGGDTSGEDASSQSRSGGVLKNFIKNNLNPLIFTPIQNFTPFNSDFSPSNIGVTSLPDPFKNFQAPGIINLVQLQTNFLNNISKFLFSALPSTITEALASSPRLATYLASVGVSKEQDIATLAANPAKLTQPLSDESTPPGLFIVRSGETTLESFVTYDASIGGLAQLIKVSPSQSLHISLISQSTGAVTATYLGQQLIFTQGSLFATTYIQTPQSGGRYILKTSSSSIPLLIEVIEPVQPIIQPKPWGIFNFMWNWFH